MILSGNKGENAIFKGKCIFSPPYRRGKYEISECPGNDEGSNISKTTECV